MFLIAVVTLILCDCALVVQGSDCEFVVSNEQTTAVTANRDECRENTEAVIEWVVDLAMMDFDCCEENVSKARTTRRTDRSVRYNVTGKLEWLALRHRCRRLAKQLRAKASDIFDRWYVRKDKPYAKALLAAADSLLKMLIDTCLIDCGCEN